MFTQAIYQTILKNRIKAINNRLLQIVQIPSLPAELQTMLIDAVMQGRRFRPLLLLIVNKGVGGKWRAAMDLACTIELLHKASLIHDDLIDGDTLRRGVPTFWKRHSPKHAIIAGDLLIGAAFRTVSEWERTSHHQYASNILDTITKTLYETAMGEWLDVHFESLTTVEMQMIETMTLLKSGSFIAASMRIGALTGCAPLTW